MDLFHVPLKPLNFWHGLIPNHQEAQKFGDWTDQIAGFDLQGAEITQDRPR